MSEKCKHNYQICKIGFGRGEVQEFAMCTECEKEIDMDTALEIDRLTASLAEAREQLKKAEESLLVAETKLSAYEGCVGVEGLACGSDGIIWFETKDIRSNEWED